MYVRCRRMRPRDVGKAVAIVAADPVVGPRYGNAISELSAVWLSLLGTESVRTISRRSESRSSRGVLRHGPTSL